MDDLGSIVLARMDDLLERYKYLSANGTNFGEPTWEEEPGPVWQALGRLFQTGSSAAPDSSSVRERAREGVMARLGPIRRRLFRKRLKRAARYLELREGVSLLMTEDTYLLRRLFLVLGHRMVEEDWMREPQDVFHLTFQEIREAVKGPGDGGSGDGVGFHALIQCRKEEIEADRDVVLPETILGEEIPFEPPVGQTTNLLTGIGASAGTVEGTARVVSRLEEAPSVLTRDDVLVVPFSDIGWTPLFATVGGIVAECGGQLSHTAIVAREYGLPAVVAARGAMQEIRDGQRIRVDGSNGSVLLMGPDSSTVPQPQS
jgi:pyruvate,water dikinase